MHLLVGAAVWYGLQVDAGDTTLPVARLLCLVIAFRGATTGAERRAALLARVRVARALTRLERRPAVLNTAFTLAGPAVHQRSQLIGVVSVAAFVAVTTGLLFLGIKATIGLRVPADEERAGLDVVEHGAPGYAPEGLEPAGF